MLLHFSIGAAGRITPASPSPILTSQAHWLNLVKTTGCTSCHALGTIGTRTIPKELGQFESSAEHGNGASSPDKR
jgi:hypothetical protein